MPKQKTIPELKAEIADNERQLRRSRYTLLPRALRSPSRRSRQAETQKLKAYTSIFSCDFSPSYSMNTVFL